MARTLHASMTQVGRIRIGDREEGSQNPRKLTSFRITTANKIALDQLAALYGGTPEPWPKGPTHGLWQLYSESNCLDVIFPSLSALSVQYERWDGRVCALRCDGNVIVNSTAETPRPGDPCQCPSDDELNERDIPLDTKERCPIVARISVILTGYESLGVWRLDTHGHYGASEFQGIVEQLRKVPNIERVPLPCFLRLEERSRVIFDREKNRKTTRKYAVPILAPKFSYERLLQAGQQATPLMIGHPDESLTKKEVIERGNKASSELFGFDPPSEDGDGAATDPAVALVTAITDVMRAKNYSEGAIASTWDRAKEASGVLLPIDIPEHSLRILQEKVAYWPTRQPRTAPTQVSTSGASASTVTIQETNVATFPSSAAQTTTVEVTQDPVSSPEEHTDTAPTAQPGDKAENTQAKLLLCQQIDDALTLEGKNSEDLEKHWAQICQTYNITTRTELPKNLLTTLLRTIMRRLQKEKTKPAAFTPVDLSKDVEHPAPLDEAVPPASETREQESGDDDDGIPFGEE